LAEVTGRCLAIAIVRNRDFRDVNVPVLIYRPIPN